jgi:hypothetical protein
MSRGFAEVGLGSVGTEAPVPLGRPLEEVLGFADAVEADAGAEALAAAAAAPLAEAGALVAIVTVVVAEAITGAALVDVDADRAVSTGFFSSIAMTPKTTPTPMSVATAAVATATPIGFFAEAPDARAPLGRFALGSPGESSCPFGAPAAACGAGLFATASGFFATPITSSRALSSVPTPRRVAAPGSDDGRDERTGGPPSRIVASIGLTAAEASVADAASSGTRDLSAGATSWSAASIRSADEKRASLSRESARATNADTLAGIDASIVRTSGASRMQIDRITCS